MKKIIVITTLSLILTVIGVVVLWILFTPKPTPLSPTASLEVKIAEKEPADGLTPVNMEYMRGETLYVYDKASLSTADVAGIYKSEDQMSRPAIAVILTRAGRKNMRSMTSSNIEKHAVIFVNGQPVSAPMIAEPDNSKKFIITASGDKDIDEVFRALTQQ